MRQGAWAFLDFNNWLKGQADKKNCGYGGLAYSGDAERMKAMFRGEAGVLISTVMYQHIVNLAQKDKGKLLDILRVALRGFGHWEVIDKDFSRSREIYIFMEALVKVFSEVEIKMILGNCESVLFEEALWAGVKVRSKDLESFKKLRKKRAESLVTWEDRVLFFKGYYGDEVGKLFAEEYVRGSLSREPEYELNVDVDFIDPSQVPW